MKFLSGGVVAVLLVLIALLVLPRAYILGLMGVEETHKYDKQLAQDERAAVAVGAQPIPKSKIAIQIIHDPGSCIDATAADIDGSRAVIYATNKCHQKVDYMEWHVELRSPDGTIIGSNYQNGAFCPVLTTPGDKGECKMEVPEDERTATARVWATTKNGL